jgi:hypothetical protein
MAFFKISKWLKHASIWECDDVHNRWLCCLLFDSQAITAVSSPACTFAMAKQISLSIWYLHGYFCALMSRCDALVRDEDVSLELAARVSSWWHIFPAAAREMKWMHASCVLSLHRPCACAPRKSPCAYFFCPGSKWMCALLATFAKKIYIHKYGAQWREARRSLC